MIKHIVVWRLAEMENKTKRAEEIKTRLEGLKDKISVIQDIQVGINFNESEAASDIVLVSEFNSKADLEEYINHPEHKAVGAELVRPSVSERRVVDYEL